MSNSGVELRGLLASVLSLNRLYGISAVPSGLGPLARPNPALKGWAILNCPSGTWSACYVGECVRRHRSAEAAKVNLLPLPRGTSGERVGERGTLSKSAPPLPGPLLPRREERENPSLCPPCWLLDAVLGIARSGDRAYNGASIGVFPVGRVPSRGAFVNFQNTLLVQRQWKGHLNLKTIWIKPALGSDGAGAGATGATPHLSPNQQAWRRFRNNRMALA